MRILGISGSLRDGSYNTKLLRAAADAVPLAAGLVEWAELAAVPPFNEDDEHNPAASVTSLREAINEADAVLVVTPEYNGSIPGQLKNALDWASRPVNESVLHNKPLAVIGTSTGMFGAASAQADARRILTRIGARVIAAELPVPLARDAFRPDGRLADEQLNASLEAVLSDLAEAVHQRESRALAAATG